LGEKCNCKQTCTANDTGKEYWQQESFSLISKYR
jgi:hypothetical protein